MPFALVIIGLMIVIATATGNVKALGAQVRADFTGPQSFVYWLGAVGVVGAIGYVPQLEKISRAFIGLLILIILIAGGNRGLFAKFQQALGSNS